MKPVETKSYYFMTYAEWWYVDSNYDIKLTRLGQSVPKVVESYEQYLKDLINEAWASFFMQLVYIYVGLMYLLMYDFLAQ